MKKILLYLLPVFILFSCNITIRGVSDEEFFKTSSENQLAPLEIRELAYASAKYYSDNSVPYEWGGDKYIEPTRSAIGVDCSGLIINNYKFAISGSNFTLPFADSTANDLYKKYSEDILTPGIGDLVFWSDKNNHIFHVAILHKIENGRYYFIDSTQIDSMNINGVSYRSEPESSIFSVRRLKLYSSK